MVISPSLPSAFLVDAIVNVLMTGLMCPPSHRGSAMSACKHTPKQIKVLERVDLMLMLSRCLSLVLCDLEKVRVDDNRCLYTNGLAQHLVCVVEISGIDRVPQDQLD
jgi:hypothetical protein